MTRLLTAREVAVRISVSLTTVRRWAASGILPAYKIGTRGDYRFEPDKISDYLKGRANG